MKVETIVLFGTQTVNLYFILNVNVDTTIIDSTVSTKARLRCISREATKTWGRWRKHDTWRI